MRVGSNPTASTFSIFFSWAHGPIPALLTFILDFGGLPDAGLLELGLMVQPQYLRWSIEIGP